MRRSDLNADELSKVEARALVFIINISANYEKYEKYEYEEDSDMFSSIVILICTPLCAISFSSHANEHTYAYFFY